MFDDILIHPLTSRNLANFIKQPGHAILLVGPRGAGKVTVALRLTAKLLDTPLDKLHSYPHLIRVAKADNKQNISIDSIRAVNKAMGLQIPGKAPIRRVVLIEDAHFMNQESQNALLKSLEEPSSYTVFILTANQSTNLLPTVISRLVKVEVRPVPKKDAESFFQASSADLESAWQLSQGLAGLMTSLLGDEDNQLKSATVRAKQLLGKDKYERILELDSLSRDKQEFAVFLDGLARVIQALYKGSAGKGKTKQTSALIKSMRLVLDCQNSLAGNVMPRLVALKLALELPV